MPDFGVPFGGCAVGADRINGFWSHCPPCHRHYRKWVHQVEPFEAAELSWSLCHRLGEEVDADLLEQVAMVMFAPSSWIGSLSEGAQLALSKAKGSLFRDHW